MIKPEEVAGQAKRKENENIRFRSYLKNHADEETLDRQFLELHKEIFDGYDCSKCRNCCKMYPGTIPEADLESCCLYAWLARITSKEHENKSSDFKLFTYAL